MKDSTEIRAPLACHRCGVDAGWWSDLTTEDRLDRNKEELLCPDHAEVSECLEGTGPANRRKPGGKKL